ncbi:probable RNA-binding protein 18, partial [Homalodisca vitripennis]|uniref:probable RNA-binding protein 18 n=1 Tax=Homalodisca vitripennis TaxID=197043 RepID=UPI001EECDA2A
LPHLNRLLWNKKSDDRRLWIGNLDTCVSEYQLLKILEKHGRMEKFDLLFHRSGPLAGQPRGYAFVTYATVEQAEMMRAAMDGKKIGSKHIAVRWAHKLTLVSVLAELLFCNSNFKFAELSCMIRKRGMDNLNVNLPQVQIGAYYIY